MVAVPGKILEMRPPETTATAVFDEYHIPPVAASVKVVVRP